MNYKTVKKLKLFEYGIQSIKRLELIELFAILSEYS